MKPQPNRWRPPSLLVLLLAVGCSPAPPPPAVACDETVGCEGGRECIEGLCMAPNPQAPDGPPPMDAMRPDIRPAQPDADPGAADAGPDEAPGDMRPCLDADDPCNEIDDDCDGRVDETHGDACASTRDVDGMAGPCQQEGIVACHDGIETCVVPMEPIESCNGIDDDCNGIVDDIPADWVPSDRPTCANLSAQSGLDLGGACHAGAWSCVQGVPQCTGRILPPREPLARYFEELVYLSDTTCVSPVIVDVDADGDVDVVCIEMPVGHGASSDFVLFENTGGGRLRNGRQVDQLGPIAASAPVSLVALESGDDVARLARIDQQNIQVYAGPVAANSPSSIWTITTLPRAPIWQNRQGLLAFDTDGDDSEEIITTAVRGSHGSRSVITLDVDDLDPAFPGTSRAHVPRLKLDGLPQPLGTVHIISARIVMGALELLIQSETALTRVREGGMLADGIPAGDLIEQTQPGEGNTFGSPGVSARPLYIDLNNDGVNEVVTVAHDGETSWLVVFAHQDGRFRQARAGDRRPGDIFAIGAGQFDCDAELEVITAGPDGIVYHPDMALDTAIELDGRFDGTSIAVGDLNGDGFDDIVQGSQHAGLIVRLRRPDPMTSNP